VQAEHKGKKNLFFLEFVEAQPTFAVRQRSANRAENKIYFDFPEAQPIFAARQHSASRTQRQEKLVFS
jgi:hypothetical protein